MSTKRHKSSPIKKDVGGDGRYIDRQFHCGLWSLVIWREAWINVFLIGANSICRLSESLKLHMITRALIILSGHQNFSRLLILIYDYQKICQYNSACYRSQKTTCNLSLCLLVQVKIKKLFILGLKEEDSSLTVSLLSKFKFKTCFS